MRAAIISAGNQIAFIDAIANNSGWANRLHSPTVC